MKTTRLLALLIVNFSLSAAAFAAGPVGTVAGRVLNPATGEYVRNARIRALPSGEVAISENGGFYQITHLPPGEVTLELSYAGHPGVTRRVTIAADATATVDFELAAAGGTGVSGEVVQLERFIVSTEREGQAKVIMEQRASMNISQHVAADVFGDNTEGNIGEFMRNLPGVLVNTSEGEVTNVNLGGLGAEYTSVTIDGVTLATANANENSSRAASFS
ncbi:MAG: TonB-dependent receptor, partial [Opitutaceae bacterium]|nr:TonB-dependent receptor [Opitutaceae bacterium]